MREPLANRTTTADHEPLAADEVRGLLEEGREQGYLTSEHIDETLRDVELSGDQLGRAAHCVRRPGHRRHRA